MSAIILGNAWGLLGLLALPTILLIHLFRRRFAPTRVTALFLYGERRQTVASGRDREPVRLQRSLWFELACALALTWWLTDPHASDRERAQHVVIVLDSRLRMNARSVAAGEHPSSWQLTARAVDERLDRLLDQDRVTLIASGAPPRLVAGPGATPAEARRALKTFAPQNTHHELDEALALAIEVGGGEARVLVASDRMPERLPQSVGVIARGTPLATSGFAEARWLDDQEGGRVVARVYAHGSAAHRTVEVRSRGGAVIAARGLSPEPGSDATAVVPIARDAIDDEVELVLTGADPLPQDDAVVLVRPQRRVVRVAVATALAAPVERALAGIPDVDAVAPGTPSAHLSITDAAAADATPAGVWRMRVAAGGASPALGPFLARRGHPLLAEVDFTGVLWSGGEKDAAIGAEDSVLLAAGDAVLVSERRRGRDHLIDLHLDLATSTLRNHPAWPSLISNLVSARRAALSGVAQPNILAGRAASAALPAGVSAVTLVAPDGRSALLRADDDGQVLIPALAQPGIHRLDIDGKPWERLNVLPLDPRLGDLDAAETQTREPAEPTSSAGGSAERRRSPLALILPLVLAALAAMLAWMAFRKEEG